MAPNQESIGSSASLVSAWREQVACGLTSPKSKYSYSNGNYTRVSLPKQRQIRQTVPVAIPEIFKVRNRCCVGGKNIPFTRFNTIACRNKVFKEDLGTIYESVFFLDLKWEDLIPDDLDMSVVDQRRLMAFTFIQ